MPKNIKVKLTEIYQGIFSADVESEVIGYIVRNDTDSEKDVSTIFPNGNNHKHYYCTSCAVTGLYSRFSGVDERQLMSADQLAPILLAKLLSTALRH